MRIRINQTAVDFTLDGERTLSDLAASLGRWAEAEGLAVTSLLADGKAVSAGSDQLLDTVNEVELEAVSQQTLAGSQLEFIAGYLALAVQSLEDGNGPVADELRSEISPVIEALSHLLAPLAPEAQQALKALESGWDPGALGFLTRLTAARAAEKADPAGAVAVAAETLSRQLEGAAELPLLFQRGEDTKAFDRILALFTALGDLDRTVPPVCREPNARTEWAAFRSELAPFLTEARSALEAGDYVLLTDLMEYEVIPRLRAVSGLLSSIINLDPVPGVL